MSIKLRIDAIDVQTPGLQRAKGMKLVEPKRINFFMHPPKTSTSHPLKIDPVAVSKGCGFIGLTFCPGKKQSNALSGVWDRNLDDDMEAINAFGAKALVTLMSDRELQSLAVPANRFRDKTAKLGIKWFQLPIPDAGIPDQRFEEMWRNAGPRLRTLLKDRHNIVIHCKGGLGRTGTIAARLLIEFGADAKSAIQSVRKARPGSIENDLQEYYILSLKG
jgi:ADP-ribosyl-[dinitrogen reductase] hydrolase